jgi:uncharacterized protein YggU (UPF0235/DUF167 family)
VIQLKRHAEGVCLPVRVQAGARENSLRGAHAGALKVTVTQAPEKGKANKAIHALLCQQLGLRRPQLTLLSGHTTSQKTFLVRACSVELLRQRIEQALSGSHSGRDGKQ